MIVDALIAFRNEYQRCRPWILSALEYADGLADEQGVLDGLLDGKYQLWPGAGCCVVTEIQKYGEVLVLRLFIIGGDLTEALSKRQFIFDWAKSIGCTKVRFDGRPGWERIAKDYGFNKVGVVMHAELGD